MKKICLTTMISVLLLICSDRMQSQDSSARLNQVELIKQFIGNWKGETGKDTTAYWDIKSSGTGIECTFKYVTKDKTIMEGNQLWSYDKKVDKFILSSATPGMDSGSHGIWFTSKDKCLFIPIRDMSNPERASFKLETDFKSPDIFVQKTFVNNNIVKTTAYNRVKN